MEDSTHLTGGTSDEPANGVPAEALAKLAAIYATLERETAKLNASCRACGDCCTFPIEGPVLYATMLERTLLSSEPAPRGEGLPPRACPYLNAISMHCAARDRRVVGCRTHFCADALPPKESRAAANELCESALDEVRRICEEHDIEWDYAGVVERVRGPGGHE